MAGLVTGAAKMLASDHIEKFAHQFEPEVCVCLTNKSRIRIMNIIQRTASKSAGKYVETGVLTVQRQIPPGLSKHDGKILHKIKKRAHVLDKGFKMCGMRFGWTFVIGLIPVVGDVTDFLLSHNLVVKKAEQIEKYVVWHLPDSFPPELLARMKANNTVSAGLGFIPFVGDIVLATFKTNSRNAHIVEECTLTRYANRSFARTWAGKPEKWHGTRAA